MQDMWTDIPSPDDLDVKTVQGKTTHDLKDIEVTPNDWADVPAPDDTPDIYDPNEHVRTAARLAPLDAPSVIAEDLVNADDSGVTYEAASRNREEINKNKQATAISSAAAQRPALNSFLRDPINAGISREDIDNLAQMHDILESGGGAFGGTIEGATGSGEDVGDIALGAGRGALRAAGRFVPQATMFGFSMVGGAAGLAHEAAKGVSELTGDELGGYFGKLRDQSFGAAEWIQDNVLQSELLSLPEDKRGALIDNMGLLLDPEWLIQNVGDAASSLAIMVGTAMATGGSSEIGAMAGGAMEGSGLYQELLDDGVDERDALYGSMAFGYMVTRFEKIGLDRMLGRETVRSGAQRMVKSLVTGGVEGFTEWLEEPTQAFIGEFTKSQDLTKATESAIAALRNIDVIPGAMVMGGGISYATKYKQELKRSERAEENKVLFQSMNEAVSGVQVRELSPMRFKMYTDKLAELPTAPESVAIPFEALSDVLQADLYDLALDMGVEDQIDTAQASGGDVVIPISNFLSTLAGTSYGVALENDFRFDVSHMTPREAAAFNDNFTDLYGPDLEASLQAAQELIDLSEDVREVVQIVKDTMLESGHSGQDASSFATLIGARAAVASEALGITPAEWLRRHKLGFTDERSGKAASIMSRMSEVEDPRAEAMRMVQDVTFDRMEEDLKGGTAFGSYVTDEGEVKNKGTDNIPWIQSKKTRAWERSVGAKKGVVNKKSVLATIKKLRDGKELTANQEIVQRYLNDYVLKQYESDPQVAQTREFSDLAAKGFKLTEDFNAPVNELSEGDTIVIMRDGIPSTLTRKETTEDGVHLESSLGAASDMFLNEDDIIEQVVGYAGDMQIASGEAVDEFTMFQTADQKNLIVTHNITPKGLMKANELGGLAAPSLAVTNLDVQTLEGYGDITLVAKSDLLEDPTVHTFDADIYSARQPRPVDKLNDKKKRKLINDITESIVDTNMHFSGRIDSEHDLDNRATFYHYLKTVGKAPKLKKAKLTAVAKAVKNESTHGLGHNPKFIKAVVTELNRQYEEIKKIDEDIANEMAEHWFKKELPKEFKLEQRGDKWVYTKDGEAVIKEMPSAPGAKIMLLRELRKEGRGFELNFNKPDSDQINQYVSEVLNARKGYDLDALKEALTKKSRTKTVRSAFVKWYEEQYADLVDSKKLHKDGKNIPYTLDNVVKEMTRTLQGGETSNYGPASVRAVYAKKLKGVKGVQAHRESFVTKEEMAKIKEESNDKLFEFAESLAPLYKYDSESWSYGSDIAEAITDQDFSVFTDKAKARKIVDEMGEYLASLPTEYFEAKAQRSMDFSEFEYAVVPKGTPKEVTDVLKSAGVKIKRYDADKGRTETLQSLSKMLFQADRSQATQPQMLPKSVVPASARGAIQIPPGGSQKIIHTFKRANKSTLFHEMGHLFLYDLEEIAKEVGGVPAQEYAAVRAFLDQATGENTVAKGEPISDKQHEYFARSFEAYLREGKAPSLELQSVFRQFKLWLEKVYRTMLSLDVDINDEIRGVFDRMLASNDQIEQAKEYQSARPMYENAEEAGMSDEAFAAYIKANKSIYDKAKEQMLKRLMADIKSRNRRWYADKRREVAATVEAELLERPDYRSMYVIQNGHLPGEESEGAERVPLKTQDILDLGFDPKTLPRTVPSIYKKAGEDAESVANLIGWTNATEMLNSLVGLQPLRSRVNEIVDERMSEYDNIMASEDIRAEAQEILDQDERIDLLALEADLALRQIKRDKAKEKTPEQVAEVQKRIREAREMAKAIRRAAVTAIDLTRNAEAGKFNKFLQAERKAARELMAAKVRGDSAAMAEAKQRQTYAAALISASVKAGREVDRILNYIKKYNSPNVRKKIDADYLDQIDALLENYDFKKSVSEKTLAKRRSIESWIKDQEDNGLEPNIPDNIARNLGKKHYKDMTLAELRELLDSIKSIDTLGRLKNKLLTDRRNKQFDEIKAELVDTAEETFGEKLGPKDSGRPLKTGLRKLGGVAKTFEADLTRVEFMCSILDGGKLNGLWWEYIYRPISDGFNRKAAKFKEIGEKLYGKDLFGRYSKEEQGRMVREVVFVDGVPNQDTRPLTKERILCCALNRGNTHNWEALLAGEGWTREQGELVLAQLEARDWELVQNTWDYINSFWSDIEELYRRLSGTAPKKVEAEPFITPSGVEMRGGYYPLVADTDLSIKAAQRDEKANVQEMMGGNAVRPTTRNGHTKERKGFGGSAVALSFDVIVRHFDQITHDIYLREAVIDVDRLIQSKEVQRVFVRTLGREMYDQLRPWLNNVAGQKPYEYYGMDKVFRFFRKNATIAMMGMKATVFISQYVGLLNVVPYLTNNTKMGTSLASAKLVHNLVKGLSASKSKLGKFVLENSIELSDRRNNFTQDVADFRTNMGFGKKVKAWEEALMYFTALADWHVSSAAWYTAYNQAIDEGKSHAAASEFGDSIVRMSQGAGREKDLPKLMRGSEAIRSFLMFFSYMNLNYNQIVSAGKMARVSGRKGKLMGELMFFWVAPALVAELAAGRGPDDDDDEGGLMWAKWATKKLLIEHPSGLIPGVRDIYSAVANALGDGYGTPATPSVKAGTALGGLANNLYKISEDEADIDADTFWKAVDAASYFVPFPSSQARITGRQTYEYITGERDDLHLLYYHKKE